MPSLFLSFKSIAIYIIYKTRRPLCEIRSTNLSIILSAFPNIIFYHACDCIRPRDSKTSPINIHRSTFTDRFFRRKILKEDEILSDRLLSYSNVIYLNYTYKIIPTQSFFSFRTKRWNIYAWDKFYEELWK